MFNRYYEFKSHISSDKLLDDHILENDPKLSIDQALINLLSTEPDCSELLQNITENEHFEKFIAQHESKEQYNQYSHIFPQESLIPTKTITKDLISAQLCSITNKNPCDICNLNFELIHDLEAHKTIHDSLDFKCETCGKTFTQKSHLTVHLKRHTGAFLVTCEPCNRGFYTMTSYRDHVQSVHEGTGHLCSTCGKKLSTKSALKEHVQLMHGTRERSAICEVCGKAFLTARNLRSHLKIHNQSYAYQCRICSRGFSDLRALENHERTHSGYKPLRCETCGKAFSTAGGLRIHRRTHTNTRPHMCNICNKRFTQRSSLVIHLRYHTGDRPYRCTLCDKAFVSRTHLNGHLKTHENNTMNFTNCNVPQYYSNTF